MPYVPRETLSGLEQFFDRFFIGVERVDIFEKFALLRDKYFEWNSRINISSIRDEKLFWEKHVLDSLCLASYIYNNRGTYKYIYDIGSGGGFPGLVLSIVLPQKIYMVESKRKKCNVINEIISVLGINAETLWKRYEEIEHIENTAIITSRALGNTQSVFSHFKAISEDCCGIFMLTGSGIPDPRGHIIKSEYEFIAKNVTDALSQHVLFEFD